MKALNKVPVAALVNLKLQNDLFIVIAFINIVVIKISCGIVGGVSQWLVEFAEGSTML